jgi:DNA-binding transcriptional MerR regulator
MATIDRLTGAEVPDRPAEVGYTIDQLQELSGVPARTIRFYRQSGLIDPPRRLGRQAFYPPDQLGRLRFIAALRARGMGLEAVGKFLADPQGEHESFTVLLSIQDQLLEPWIDDRSAVVDLEELKRLIDDDDPQVLADILRFGLAAEKYPDRDLYEIPSVIVLEMAVEMKSIGIEPAVGVSAWLAMQKRVAELADDLVTIFAEDPDHGFADNDTAAEISAAFARLRPVAMRAVQVAFAQEIQRALSEYLALAASADSIVPRRAAEPWPQT